ncbi:MAG TPA: helix-turn-helix transcriptional regulator [bacterium]|nr:helix-turn-helix transcriptional regulator [bacterium]HPN46229.1 helix-turn-helix transcriptional regulator [bacterium]
MIDKDLMAASSRPLILTILSQHESYGYEIIKKIHELSNDEIQWKDGMLYPVLHKLEKEGCIESFVKISETGRKRKYYRIKSEGTKLLETQRKQWNVVNSVFNLLMEKKPCLS